MKKQIPQNMKAPLRWWHRFQGFRMVGDFIAINVETFQVSQGDWRWLGTYTHRAFAYYCPECGERLAEGPSGGGSVNCVCKTCRINFGSLPNNEHE